MSKRPQFNWRMVLLYPAVFLIVVSAGFIYGLMHLKVPSSTVPTGLSLPPLGEETPAVSTAPTADEYWSAAELALEPFLAVVAENQAADVVPADDQARQRVESSIQAMLALTVPAGERDFHLSAVLLMEQWKRALSGSSLDARRAVASAEKFLDDYPWLAPSATP